jgi:kynurenine 3-monooxygenase
MQMRLQVTKKKKNVPLIPIEQINSDMALENFVEMRDKVNDQHFQLKKKYQHALGLKYPTQFYSRYELVSFSQIPYSEAKKIGEISDAIAEELMTKSHCNLDQMDWELAESLIVMKLNNKLCLQSYLGKQ